MAKNFLHTPAAWATWLLLVAVAAGALLLILVTPDRPAAPAAAWFLVPVLWLMFAVPGAVLLHGHALSATGDSAVRADDDDTTLNAARSVWGVLLLGVVLSLVAARVSGAVSPSVWPGAVMFMLLILARPGRAA